MAKCPLCKREIDDDARKCPHCGSGVTILRRFLSTIKSIVEFATFVAAIFVLVVMYRDSKIMRDSLLLSQETVRQGWENIKLLTEEHDLWRQDIELSRTSVEVQKNQQKLSKAESMVTLQPNMEIDAPVVTVSDTGLHILVPVENIGRSDAWNVLAEMVCKFSFPVKDTLRFKSTFDKITTGRRMVLRYFIYSASLENFNSFVNLKYSWASDQEKFENHKYFEHVYNKESRTFSSSRIDDVRGREIMK